MSIITQVWSTPRIGVRQRLERQSSVDTRAERSLAARTKSLFRGALTIAVFVAVVVGIVASKSWIWTPFAH